MRVLVRAQGALCLSDWAEKSDLLETSDRLLARQRVSTEKETANMGKSQSKLVEYDTPVYWQMKKVYGQKCMQDMGKLIKYHGFPKEGTLSVKRLKAVKESVEEESERQKGCCVKHMCEKCEQTVNC